MRKDLEMISKVVIGPVLISKDLREYTAEKKHVGYQAFLDIVVSDIFYRTSRLCRVQLHWTISV